MRCSGMRVLFNERINQAVAGLGIQDADDRSVGVIVVLKVSKVAIHLGLRSQVDPDRKRNREAILGPPLQLA